MYTQLLLPIHGYGIQRFYSVLYLSQTQLWLKRSNWQYSITIWTTILDFRLFFRFVCCQWNENKMNVKNVIGCTTLMVTSKDIFSCLSITKFQPKLGGGDNLLVYFKWCLICIKFYFVHPHLSNLMLLRWVLWPMDCLNIGNGRHWLLGNNYGFIRVLGREFHFYMIILW